MHVHYPTMPSKVKSILHSNDNEITLKFNIRLLEVHVFGTLFEIYTCNRMSEG